MLMLDVHAEDRRQSFVLKFCDDTEDGRWVFVLMLDVHAEDGRRGFVLKFCDDTEDRR